MSKSIPDIKKYMTTNPHSLNPNETIERAEKMMREFKIRHLPIMNGGKLVGIVSDRDLKFVQGFKNVDIKNVTLTDVAREDVYIANPDSKLSDVVSEMALHKYGCAVILDNQKLVGIFTDVDAMRALADLLQTRLS